MSTRSRNLKLRSNLLKNKSHSLSHFPAIFQNTTRCIRFCLFVYFARPRRNSNERTTLMYTHTHTRIPVSTENESNAKKTRDKKKGKKNAAWRIALAFYYCKLHSDLIIKRNWISLTTTSACVRAVDDLDLLGVMPTTSPLMMLSTTVQKRSKLKLTLDILSFSFLILKKKKKYRLLSFLLNKSRQFLYWWIYETSSYRIVSNTNRSFERFYGLTSIADQPHLY